MNRPWISIADSIVVSGGDNTLNYNQAKESPCLSCTTSPCCTHLPLNTFSVTNIVELDHAVYLLNFDRIELGISAAGEWSAYYTQPCRYLDRNTYLCSVHASPEQPKICSYYNPYNCWYKRAFTGGQNPEFVRIDRARLNLLLEYITLDEDRQISSVPAWEDLIEMMRQFDDKKNEFSEEPLLEDRALNEWEKFLLKGADGKNPNDSKPVSINSIDNPCDSCEAYCCKSLVFPQSFPANISNLDYYRFCLGFPGIELGIFDGGWSIIVKTTCRHLDDKNRCSLFGKPDRPLICQFYDEWKCDYKPQFGQARPEAFMRLRLEQFNWLVQSFEFDRDGNILAMPSLEEIRQSIEERWRKVGALPVMPVMTA